VASRHQHSRVGKRHRPVPQNRQALNWGRDSPLPRYKREQQAFRALCGMGIAKDVLVFTREEFDRGLAVVSSLPATVVREGRLLYGE